MKLKDKKYLSKNNFEKCPECKNKLVQNGASTNTIFFESIYICSYCGNVYYYYSTKFLQFNNFFKYKKIKLINKDDRYTSIHFNRKEKINKIINVQKRDRKKIFSKKR